MVNLGTLSARSMRSLEAAQWFRRAAEAGHADAMVRLGFLLEDSGRAADAAEAERWYRSAAEAGDPAPLGEVNSTR
jgi:TPR repeat protein